MLLVTVVLSTMILSRWLGPDQQGHALPGLPPDPPAVGDCLKERVPTIDQTGDQRQRPWYAPCDGVRAGEVVMLDVTEPERCAEAVHDFLGLQPDGSLPGAEVGWSPPRAFGAVLMGPSASQRLAGQDWSACALVSTAPGLVPTYPATARQLYPNSTRLAAGGCAATTFPLADTLPCSDPHRVEWFAATERVAIGSDPGLVERECTSLLRTQLDSVDPTRGGLLAVVAPTYVLDEQGRVQLWWSSDRAAGASCGLQPTDRSSLLVGSLRGLGEGAVPLVGD